MTPWTPGTDCGRLGRRGLIGGVHSVHGVHKNAQCPASQEAALGAGPSQSLTDYAKSAKWRYCCLTIGGREVQ